MRPSPIQIPVLLAVALLAQGPAAHARDATGGAAPGTVITHATAEDQKDPSISRPKEPGVDCYVEETQADAANIREKARINQLGKPCLPQQDAFKRAAEAASYLAFYQQNFSDYGVKMRDKDEKADIQAAVKECLNGGPKCDDSPEGNKMKHHLFQALVQYNFGKDLRAQMLENQTRAKNMHSLDLSPAELRELGWQEKRTLSWKGSLRSAHVREETFRLDPRNVVPFEADKLTAEERAKLGAEFNENFNSFVNEYTSSTGQRGPKSRWAYVATRSAAVGGSGSVWVTQPDQRNDDPREGKSAIDKGRLARDIKTQDAKVVNEIVATFREDFKDVLGKPLSDKTLIDKSKPAASQAVVVKVDSMQRAYEVAGFGLPQAQLADIGKKDGPRDAKDVAGQIVLDINKALTESERKLAKDDAQNQRVPSSAAGPGAPKVNMAPSVTVDVAAFDKFLDDIWPTSEPKP